MRYFPFFIIIIFLSIVHPSSVFAEENDSNKKNDMNDVNHYIQPGWYDTRWYEWYNTLSPKIQSNVNLPEFSDFAIQTNSWFVWYNQLSPEIQCMIKPLDPSQWNEQTSKWLEWFSLLTPELQNEINLQGERTLYDRYNSLPIKGQDAMLFGLSGDLFASIQLSVYEIPLRDSEILRGTTYDLVWYNWFNSLSLEEQNKVYYRPKNFALIQRGVYGISAMFKEAYMTVYKEIPLTHFRIDGQPIVSYNAADLIQTYEPTSLDKVYEIALYEDGNSVDYAKEQFTIKFNLSDSDISLDDISNLRGVLYDGDKISEYINGTYNHDTKDFTFAINKPGNYAVTIVKNTTQLKSH